MADVNYAKLYIPNPIKRKQTIRWRLFLIKTAEISKISNVKSIIHGIRDAKKSKLSKEDTEYFNSLAHSKDLLLDDIDIAVLLYVHRLLSIYSRQIPGTH